MQAAGWRPMVARDSTEQHRQASFLELFFDLCFVVAVAQAASELHHAVVQDHAGSGLVSYLTVFFAIWWAWVNFSWFASAYDNDDVPFRIAAFVQITGSLIVAAGVERAFAERDFGIIFVGYAAMRVGLVFGWIRAARHDPERRRTALRYGAGISSLMLGWGVMFVSGTWPLWGWWLMACLELAVPAWAESAGRTPWHPGHIAERYGLFTIIVLGESVLSSTQVVKALLEENGGTLAVLRIAAGGLLTLFSLWWLYFAKSAERFLTSTRAAYLWGVGHYFILAAGAAVGAALGINLDLAQAHGEVEPLIAGATLTVAVAVFLLVLWLLQFRPHGTSATQQWMQLVAVGAVLAATFSPWPVLSTGVVCAGLVAGLRWSARCESTL